MRRKRTAKQPRSSLAELNDAFDRGFAAAVATSDYGSADATINQMETICHTIIQDLAAEREILDREISHVHGMIQRLGELKRALPRDAMLAKQKATGSAKMRRQMKKTTRGD